MSAEVSHYVVTAHPPGAVLLTTSCNFLSPHTNDVIVAKSRRLEVRQAAASSSQQRESSSSSSSSSSPFPVVLTLPINGRITSMVPIKLPRTTTTMTATTTTTDYLFLTTDRYRYAVISYCGAGANDDNDDSDNTVGENHPYYSVKTHASGSLRTSGREPTVGPLVSVDPYGRLLALHLYDGILTFIPIHVDYKPPSRKGGRGQRGTFPGGSGSVGSGHHHHSSSSILGEPYQVRMEERALLDLTFVHMPAEKPPHLCLLHQDSRSAQHLVTYSVDIRKKQLSQMWKRSRVDGGSSMLLAVPPPVMGTAAGAVAASRNATANTTTTTNSSNVGGNGGVVVVGQRQITYLNTGVVKVVPLPSCVMTAAIYLGGSTHGCRYLMGDEFGKLHLLTIQSNGIVEMETLGSCNIANALAKVNDNGLVFVGSAFGDSQLVQVHSEPLQQQHDSSMMMEGIVATATTFLEIVEEYTNLGPIVDFDLVPTHAQQSQVVTCSGSSLSGSLRLVRNGIGMNECASVEMEGIQHMWSVKHSWNDTEDAYLVQSFVGGTRVLGVSVDGEEEGGMDEDQESEVGGTLEEVILAGLDSTSSSLYVGNVGVGDTILQITESQVRLIAAGGMKVSATWSPEGAHAITAAAANEAGQVAISLRGGVLLYLRIQNSSTIELCSKTTFESEVGCLDLNPFVPGDGEAASMMDVDEACSSKIVAVGLWDDFSVRLLSLESNLEEVLSISLSTEEDDEEDIAEVSTRKARNDMMARSLCLIALGSASTTSSSGIVDMLFVGLGDGMLVSYAILERDGRITATSKKEVSLGTQRIDLVPLETEQGGRCVLATGDRPTVIYLTGGGGAGANFSNPKLCYSSVNLSTSDSEADGDVNRPPAQQRITVNAATPFVSPQLFDVSSVGSKHFSLCISDASNLRLGVIDDIQKLHVTTCQLGMAPRRVVHCSEDRLFAVGCIESGLDQGGSISEEANMGNCIRFLDDTNFDDIHRIDLEPFEMVLSMVYANLGPAESSAAYDGLAGMSDSDSRNGEAKPYLLIGTGYALPDEDEPTRGRIIVLSCSSGGTDGGSRAVRQVTELVVRGGVYSMCQFYEQKVLVTVNTKTQVCHLADDGTGLMRLGFLGIGHHGHVLSLLVKSKAKRSSASKRKSSIEDEAIMEDTPTKKVPSRDDDIPEEQLAIVGDLMRSISLVRYYPEHKALEEIARDFNANWTTAMEMITDSLYLGSENWNNLYMLRRNVKAQSEEVRCRLDTVGEFHLGEMCNKIMCGSLVMPHSKSSSGGRRKVALRMASPVKGGSSRKDGKVSAATRAFRPTVTIGTQALYATVDGTLGAILGLDAHTTAFFKTLERAMAKTIVPVGDFGHAEFRAFDADRRVHPSHGFVDGDMVESFLDLDRASMEAVVKEVNRDGGWDIDSFTLRNEQDGDAEDEEEERVENHLELTVEDVLAMVEEMTMFH